MNPRDAINVYTISNRAPSAGLGDFSIFPILLSACDNLFCTHPYTNTSLPQALIYYTESLEKNQEGLPNFRILFSPAFNLRPTNLQAAAGLYAGSRLKTRFLLPAQGQIQIKVKSIKSIRLQKFRAAAVGPDAALGAVEAQHRIAAFLQLEAVPLGGQLLFRIV